MTTIRVEEPSHRPQPPRHLVHLPNRSVGRGIELNNEILALALHLQPARMHPPNRVRPSQHVVADCVAAEIVKALLETVFREPRARIVLGHRSANGVVAVAPFAALGPYHLQLVHAVLATDFGTASVGRRARVRATLFEGEHAFVLFGTVVGALYVVRGGVGPRVSAASVWAARRTGTEPVRVALTVAVVHPCFCEGRAVVGQKLPRADGVVVAREFRATELVRTAVLRVAGNRLVEVYQIQLELGAVWFWERHEITRVGLHRGSPAGADRGAAVISRALDTLAVQRKQTLVHPSGFLWGWTTEGGS